jgi:Protein kinase domain
MSKSPSCIGCGVVLPEASLLTVCPTCHRDTDRDADAKTVNELLRDQGSTHHFHAAGHNQFLLANSDTAEQTRQQGFTALTSWEQSQIPELARRGYRVLCKLGEGGFGVVFKALDASERIVAIKILHATLGHDRYRQRFAIEANALTRVNDPGLVQLFHFDVNGADPMLVTEFVPGGTLAQKLIDQPIMVPTEAAAAIAQLARVIHKVHSVGVIHRDIKPSNILIGSDGQWKLGDFGLAKRLDRDDDLTPTGRGIGGTPEYSAPEQFRCSGDCDARADIYALGATLYRMLTGQPVFQRNSTGELLEVILRVLSDEPVPPRKHVGTIPRVLEAICLKCLAKNPTDRYRSAGELAADLDAWRAGELTVAQPRSWVGRAWRSARAVPKFPVALLLMGILILGAAPALLRKKDVPVDPLDAMMKQLKNGETVELVGATGKPRWHRWMDGSAELVESTDGEKSCAFESLSYCTLELFPEVPLDHYLLRGQIRMVSSCLMAEDRALPSAGIFIGGQKTVLPETEWGSTYAMASMFYMDGNGKKVDNMHFGLRCDLMMPDSQIARCNGQYAHVPFMPTKRLPGEWQTFEIEVSANAISPRVYINGILTYFKHGNAQLPFFTISEIESIHKSFELDFSDILGWKRFSMPEWNSRGAVGIASNAAALNFRNVILVPLP